MGSLSLLQVDHPDPAIKPGSPALQADSLPTELSRKPLGFEVYQKGPEHRATGLAARVTVMGGGHVQRHRLPTAASGGVVSSDYNVTGSSGASVVGHSQQVP